MPRELYNEGRVVGYSAYEVYVRHAMSVDPDTQPASELEWLSSSIATGSSMLVQIPAEYGSESGHHFIDIKFPSNTKLAAANTILGSFFLGTAVFNGNWATKVTSYGPLLTNSTIYPSTSASHTSDYVEYPHTVSTPLSQAQQSQLREYVKVIDAIIIQPGRWKDATATPPFKDFEPDLSDVPTLRIFLADKIYTSFNILLTGFTLRTVLDGVSGLDGSTDTSTNEYQDGGFLGPAVYPWANKVVFSVPPALINYAVKLNADYTRTIDGSTESVDSASTIDMEATDPSSYYTTNYTTTPVSYAVTKNNMDNAVLTVYQRSSVLPPALYGTKVTHAGNSKLYPLDTVAPGTTKIFEGSNSQSEATATNQIPGNIGMYRDSNYIIHQTVPSQPINSSDPISDTSVSELPADRLGGQRPFALKHTSGKKSGLSLSLTDAAGNILLRTGIHAPTFDANNTYQSQGPNMSAVTAEPSDWETSFSTYFNAIENFHPSGDGTTTTFTLPSPAPDSLDAVTLDDSSGSHIQTRGTDWSYSDGVITFLQTAPPSTAAIYAYVHPEGTFETMDPLREVGDERFLERTGTLHWDDLLFALANNKAIDLFDNDYFLSKFAELLADKLVAGEGIGIDNDSTIQSSSKSTIRLKLSPRRTLGSNPVTAGGLTMSKASGTDTQKYIRVNPGDGIEVVNDAVCANIKAGAGIDVSTADGAITITNTGYINYTSADCYDDFRFNVVNNFRGYVNGEAVNDEETPLNGINRTLGTYKYKCSLSYTKSDDNSIVQIKVAPASSYEDTSTTPSTTFDCRLGMPNFLYRAYGPAMPNDLAQDTLLPNRDATHTVATTSNTVLSGAANIKYNAENAFAFLHTSVADIYCQKSNILNIKFTNSFIEKLFGSCFVLTTHEPDDWGSIIISSTQQIYFTFTVLSSKPADWDNYYYDYFTKVNGIFKYVTNSTWSSGVTYYKREQASQSAWASNTYYVDVRHLYKFIDTSSLSTGLWNIRPLELRASWQASCGLRANSEKYLEGNVWDANKFAFGRNYYGVDNIYRTIVNAWDEENGVTEHRNLDRDSVYDISICGFSYADGFNTQIPDVYPREIDRYVDSERVVTGTLSPIPANFYNLDHASLVRGSAVINLHLWDAGLGVFTIKPYYDDGAGNLYSPQAVTTTDIGTINYTSGKFKLNDAGSLPNSQSFIDASYSYTTTSNITSNHLNINVSGMFKKVREA